MPRLIDADALFYKLVNTDPNTEGRFCDGAAKAMEFILNAPTIDPESLRPKGEWKLNEDGKWACTYCESLAIEHPTDTDWQVITAFCPNCGADMRGET